MGLPGLVVGERMKVGIAEEQGGFTWTGGERGEGEDEGWDSRRAGLVLSFIKLIS